MFCVVFSKVVEIMKKIAVIGAGTWGTSLCKLLAEKGEDVHLWAFEPEVAAGINEMHRNPWFLPEIDLPENLRASNDLSEVMSDAVVVVSVLPSHVLKQVWTEASQYLSADAIVVSCTKGVDPKSFLLMSQLLDAVLPDHDKNLRCVLSGPSFAKEVAQGLPTSVVLAGSCTTTCEQVQQLFRTTWFLPFLSDDMIGVQVGGAVKNVLAIAAGIGAGLELGHNAQAMIVTRGLYEMIKVGQVLGANPLTFSGLSGIGDLVLTATSDLSRNYQVGKLIGQGKDPKKLLQESHMVAEGMETAQALRAIGEEHKLNIPICISIAAILNGKLQPKDALAQLTSLPLGNELRSIQG